MQALRQEGLLDPIPERDPPPPPPPPHQFPFFRLWQVLDFPAKVQQCLTRRNAPPPPADQDEDGDQAAPDDEDEEPDPEAAEQRQPEVILRPAEVRVVRLRGINALLAQNEHLVSIITVEN